MLVTTEGRLYLLFPQLFTMASSLLVSAQMSTPQRSLPGLLYLVLFTSPHAPTHYHIILFPFLCSADHYLK